VGPTVQSESFDILHRFREEKFVVMCDITKMYRQIWVEPSQRKYMRNLWRSNFNEPLRHYEMNTVTFGTSCAPFLATRVLVQIAEENKEKFPEAAMAILRSFYVDDGLLSFKTIEDAVRICSQIRYLFNCVGMVLCKFASNCEKILEEIPPHLVDVAKDESSVTKALGVGYDAAADVFFYRLKPITMSTSTKAIVLSEIASIYDPIGWIGPVVLTAKLLMKNCG
jgi:Reverse transcriptase (RNA-dependent DNA polymerase)/Pao retrotransposon peptidase